MMLTMNATNTVVRGNVRGNIPQHFPVLPAHPPIRNSIIDNMYIFLRFSTELIILIIIALFFDYIASLSIAVYVCENMYLQDRFYAYILNYCSRLIIDICSISAILSHIKKYTGAVVPNNGFRIDLTDLICTDMIILLIIASIV